MAIQIEIISRSGRRITAAFYYPAPTPTALANDQTREPAGIRLSASEIMDLKAGTLIEFVASTALRPGSTKAQAKAKLETAWVDLQAKAIAEYVARYRFVGIAWNGTAWSNA